MNSWCILVALLMCAGHLCLQVPRASTLRAGSAERCEPPCSRQVPGKTIRLCNYLPRELIADICKSDAFSHVMISVEEPCPYGSLVEKHDCGLSSCSLKQKHAETAKALEKKDSLCKLMQTGEFIKEVQVDGKPPKKYAVVDLRELKERYTGYTEGSAVWKKAYSLADGDGSLCMFLSGIHCSVSVHLSAFYNENLESGLFFMNGRLMEEKVRPDYFENMKRTFDFLLSAIPLVASQINPTTLKISERDCCQLEALLEMLPRGRVNYRIYGITEQTLIRANAIAGLMNCVECPRCKIWGKIQLGGLKAALKAVYAETRSMSLHLEPGEIVYFFNLLNKLSTSFTKYGEYECLKMHCADAQKKKARNGLGVVDALDLRGPILPRKPRLCTRALCKSKHTGILSLLAKVPERLLAK
jgi:Endoplasmic Reticulum Oxidoreductin 1 (ERO1)